MIGTFMLTPIVQFVAVERRHETTGIRVTRVDRVERHLRHLLRFDELQRGLPNPDRRRRFGDGGSLGQSGALLSGTRPSSCPMQLSDRSTADDALGEYRSRWQVLVAQRVSELQWIVGRQLEELLQAKEGDLAIRALADQQRRLVVARLTRARSTSNSGCVPASNPACVCFNVAPACSSVAAAIVTSRSLSTAS